MAYQIRINPNALREAGSRISAIGNQVQEALDILRNQAVRLNAAWDGNAGARAADSLMHSIQSLQPLTEALESSGRRLKAIAEVFSEADTASPGSVRPMDTGLINSIIKIGSRNMSIAVSTSENTLSVAPYALYQIADRIRDAGEMLWDISRQLNSVGETLAADWEGRAYDRFMQDNQVTAEAMKHASYSLRENAARISHAAARYEQMDAELS